MYVYNIETILLYGSDVQLYIEKAFQNNIKSIYMYPAHIYTTKYKETNLHQSSMKKIWCARRASILSQFGFIPVSSLRGLAISACGLMKM